MTTTTTLRVVSSQLRGGDVVLTHGMRVQIDRPITTHHNHNRTNTTVYSTRGLVINPHEVREAGVVPWSWLTDDGESEEPRWTIQGNDLKSWDVERADTYYALRGDHTVEVVAEAIQCCSDCTKVVAYKVTDRAGRTWETSRVWVLEDAAASAAAELAEEMDL